PNLRIVKGAYLEPESIAYPDKADVDRVYLELVERGLHAGAYIAVATHDETIIRKVQAFTTRDGIPRDRFEFQMLYGVRPGLQRSVAAEGYKVLVASPSARRTSGSSSRTSCADDPFPELGRRRGRRRRRRRDEHRVPPCGGGCR